GVVFPHRVAVRPTNLSFLINTNDIIHATGMKELFIINDFEAVALGLELVDPRELIIIKQGADRRHANRGFLGAGTGLGKSLLVWHKDQKRYFPVASEGGHSDAVFYDPEDLEL